MSPANFDESTGLHIAELAAGALRLLDLPTGRTRGTTVVGNVEENRRRRAERFVDACIRRGGLDRMRRKCDRQSLMKPPTWVNPPHGKGMLEANRLLKTEAGPFSDTKSRPPALQRSRLQSMGRRWAAFPPTPIPPPLDVAAASRGGCTACALRSTRVHPCACMCTGTCMAPFTARSAPVDPAPGELHQRMACVTQSSWRRAKGSPPSCLRRLHHPKLLSAIDDCCSRCTLCA